MGCDGTKVKDTRKSSDYLELAAKQLEEQDRKRRYQELDDETKRKLEEEYKQLEEEEKEKLKYIEEYYRIKEEENYVRQKANQIDVDINGIYHTKEVEKNRKIIFQKEINIEKAKWNEVLKQHKETQEKKRKKLKGLLYGEETKANILRILLIGESESGKTTIANRFCYDNFIQEHKMTQEIKVYFPVSQIFENRLYHIKIVDTPPYEDFIDHIDEELPQADVVIFVYDVSSKGALQRIQEMITEIDFYEEQKWAIIANKKDKCPEYEKYRIHELSRACHEFGMTYTLTSTKKSSNDIKKLFMELFCSVYPLVNKEQTLNK